MSVFASHLQSGSIRLRVASPHSSSSSSSSSPKEFIVHRSLLSQNLSHLHLSAHERYVELEGDEDSIGYLLEYIYTGDYRPSSSIKTTSPEAPLHEETSSAGGGGEGGGGGGVSFSLENGGEEHEQQHPMVVAARTSTLGVWGRPAAVHTRYWREPAGAAQQPARQEETANGEVTDHVASVAQETNGATSVSSSSSSSSQVTASFLVHAKVYLLAERYGASALKEFALQKLKAALKTSELEVRTDHVASLVELIGRVYGLPAGSDGQDAETRQALRQVVLAQAVNSLPDLQTNEHFKSLLKDGGDFVEDLLCHLTKTRLALQ